MKKLLFLAVLATGCSVKYKPTEQSVTVKKETKEMLLSKVDKMAGRVTDGYTYYFIMNENKTFAAVVNMDATKQYEFCAGTYKSNNDTLTLNYYKNYKSQYFTDKAVINNISKEIIFIGDDAGEDRRVKLMD